MKKDIVLIFKKYTPKKVRLFLRKLRRYFLYYFQSFSNLKFSKNYLCPINDKKYRTFIKDGNLLLSLGFGARERHRFIWHYIQSETNLFKQNGISLLHISPEFCFYEKLRQNKNIQYFPVDKFEPGYDYMSLTKNFDLLDKNLESEKYDFIICNHVLEHITDDKTAIENLFKILKKSGTGILSVPILSNNLPTFEDDSIISPKERKKHFGQWDHVRYYGTDIHKRFEKAGFEVKTVNAIEYLNDSERKKYGVPNESYLFHLTKPIN